MLTPKSEPKKPVWMTVFTPEDVGHLLDDLQLYSGNITKITGVHGPHPQNGSLIGGVIHTSMDTFNFTANPMFCDEGSWMIQLADPTASLREGHRINTSFTFPKIHKDQGLQKRYQVANLLYTAYNGFSNVSEANRLLQYEQILGYTQLPSYSRVLRAIIKDFRSFQQKRIAARREKHSNN